MDARDKGLQDYDRYISESLAPEDDALRGARETAEREGLPSINVSRSEGKLLHMALLSGARRVLELGTLGGYSATWLARASADGRVVSLELDPHHAEVARGNLERAGLAAKVEVRIGPALESLAAITAAGEEPFDVVFIDADKGGYVDSTWRGSSRSFGRGD